MGSNVLIAWKCLLGSCERTTFIYDLEDECIISEVNQIWKS